MADAATAPDTDWVPTDSFGARLALVRIERHWNITQAAQTCGIDPENWRGWERGRSPHKIHDVARKIADGTGVNYVWLLAGGPLRSRCFSVIENSGRYFQPSFGFDRQLVGV